MSLYTYTVKDKSGKTINGKMEQDRRQAVAEKLSAMGYTIIEINEEVPGVFSLDIGEKLSRVKPIDKVNFYVKLSSMLRAGVPLAGSLESVREQLSNKKFQNIIADIHRNILAGNSFSQSLALYPKIFPELLLNVVHSGEASGRLIEVLEEYAAFADNQVSLHKKVTSALIYPAILIIAAIGLVFIFLTFLLPRFVDLFDKANVPLPTATQFLVSVGNFFGNNAVLLTAIMIITITLLAALPRFPLGRKFLDRLKLRLPLVGTLVSKIALARFARCLGTLYTSGVPIIKSLEIARQATGNSIYAEALNAVKEGVTKGKSLAGMLQEDPLFPKDIIHMLAVGESSGNLSAMLARIADIYERDADYVVKNITSLLEPVIILFVGIIVGCLVYSIIVPIFSMMTGL